MKAKISKAQFKRYRAVLGKTATVSDFAKLIKAEKQW